MSEVPGLNTNTRLESVVATVGCSVLGALAGAAYVWIPRGHAGADTRLSMMLPVAAAGAIAGPVLYWTRAWRRRDHVRALLGWTVSGAVAGAIMGGSGASDSPASMTAAAVGAFFGAFLFTMGRYCWWAYLNSGEDDTRSAGERNGQLIVLSLVSVPILLMALLAAA